MSNLTIALCISIGTGVPWLMAIHSDRSARRLFWNSVLGLAGAFVCAIALDRITPTYSILVLIGLGPLATLFFIVAGQALWRAVSAPRS